MIRPILFVGLGGSGGKTLRYTAKQFRTILQEKGWDDTDEQGNLIPEAWQFLHIDVPGTKDIDGGDVPADVGGSIKWIGLSDKPSDGFDAFADRLRHKAGNLDSSLVSWAPPAHAQTITAPFSGAGQKRVVGRVVGLSRFDEIQAAIDKALNTMQGDAAKSRFDKAVALLAPGASRQDASGDSPIVFIISSVGGGSGSGLLSDVTDYLANMKLAQNDLHTVIFTGDIYDHLDEGSREGIYPNTIAALSELLNGQLQRGATSLPEARLMTACLGGNSEGVRGARDNIIISNSNGKFYFNDQHACFRSVGNMLASLAVGDGGKSYEEITNFAKNNQQGQGFTDGFRLFGSGSQELQVGAVNSLGFASVSLGSQLLENFASEALARHLITTLIEGPLSHSSGNGNGAGPTHADRVSAASAQQRAAFIEESGLNEQGEQNNQVYNHLWNPDEIKKRWRDFKETAKLSGANKGYTQQLDELAEADGGSDVLYKKATDTHRNLGTRFLGQGSVNGDIAGFESEQRERATQLVSTVEQKVITISLTYAAQFGVDTSLELLQELKLSATEGAQEMRNDAAASRKRASQQTSTVGKLKDAFSSAANRVGAGDERLKELKKTLDGEFLFSLKARAHDNAASILEGAAQDLIPAVTLLMSGIKADLETDRKDARRGGKAFAQFPAFDDPKPSSHLRPAPNEILLIEPDDEKEGFLATVKTYLPKTFGIDTTSSINSGFSLGRDLAVSEILSGCYTHKVGTQGSVVKLDGQKIDVQDLVRTDFPWGVELQDGTVAGGGQSSGVGIYTTAERMTVQTIRDRCDAWIEQRADSELRTKIRTSLRDWLNNPDGKNQRQARFVDLFTRAFDYARPMVDVDSQAYGWIHGGNEPTVSFALTGEIPVKGGSDAYSGVIELLGVHGIDTSASSGLIDGNSEATSIGIIGKLSNPLHLAAVRSVAEPIYTDWKKRSSDQQFRMKYWSYRRGRQIDNFVPISRRHLLALMRGWILTGYLGQLRGTTTSRDWVDEGMSIWTPAGWKSFPRYPMVREIDGKQNLFARLVETLPMAMLGYGVGDREPIEAFDQLLSLGNEAPEGGVQPQGTHSRFSPTFEHWLLEGKLEEPTVGIESPPAPNQSDCGAIGSDSVSRDERRARFASTLEALDELRFKVAFDQLDGVNENTYGNWEPYWDLGAIGLEATQALRSALAGLDQVSEAEKSLPSNV